MGLGAALLLAPIPFVNLFAHLGPALARGAYNPGLVTAVLLFLPLSIWTFHVAMTRYRMGWRAVIATVAAGIVLHGILMASLLAYIAGRIGVVTLDAIQWINPAIAALIVMRLGRPAAPLIQKS